MKITWNIPSYKRPKVESLDYIPFANVYVDESEADEYKAENKNGNIIACPTGIQGNLCRIRNYIMDEEFKKGADAVVIVDDDMEGIYYWECDKDRKTIENRKIQTDELKPLIEKYTIICHDLDFAYWGMNCNQDKLSYRQYSPFSFVSYIGGPFQCFLKKNICRYDERLPLKEDYDMTLQQCNIYRGCLRCNFLTYNVKQAKQTGGCASYRNLETEKQQFECLRKKWGGSIVKEDKGNSRKGNKRSFDFNPIIKIPIKGI